MILLQPGEPPLANVHAQVPCPARIRSRDQGAQLDRMLGGIDDLHVADTTVPKRRGPDDLLQGGTRFVDRQCVVGPEEDRPRISAELRVQFSKGCWMNDAKGTTRRRSSQILTTT